MTPPRPPPPPAAPTFTETSTVQTWMRERLESLGWTYVPPDEVPRERIDVFVDEWLIEALELLNPEIHGYTERVDEVMPVLRSAVLSAGTDGLVSANEAMTVLLRGDHTVKYVGTDEHVPLRLIAFDNLAENTFYVTDEVTYGPVGAGRRYDLVLWVNGIPLVVVETKTPVKATVSWLNAARDLVNVYQVEGPAFFTPNVLMVATEGRHFHYGGVGQGAEDWRQWGSSGTAEDLDGFDRVKVCIDGLLTPARVLSMLKDFTLFERLEGGAIIKLLARYPQVEAAELMHARVLSEKRKGLVSHYQGSGKTLLMAYLGLMLLNDPEVGGPTVLVVSDRIDLVEQTARQFRTAGTPRTALAENKAQLRRMLREDKRGIVLTTIHRFEREDKSVTTAPVLNTRDNIIVLVDEAHRTTEGTLGDDMRAALPKARFFGLTGSPVAEKDRNTFKLFGDPDDPDFVLHEYTAGRSIADGMTVPIHVETRLVDYHLDKDALDDAFDELADDESLSEEERDFLAGQAATVKTLVMNPARIRAVCADILDHFEAKIAPLGMKAQIVAYDRELVVAYETELNRILAERGLAHETQIVMSTGGKNDPAAWSKYAITRAEENAIKRRFRDYKDPLAFIIVTAKFLTGFDAPIEQVMYLDKAMRKQTLFQAITRPNRRFTHPQTKQEKRHGLIVDYVGLGTQIAEALAPKDPTKGGRHDIDVAALAAEFKTRMAAILSPRFDSVDRTDTGFVALQAAITAIGDKDGRDKFAREFTGVEALWEFLAPDPLLDAHKADYTWLAKVYEAIKPTGISNDLLWARLGAKTLNLVHGNISDVAVTGTGLEEVVVDPEAIKALKEMVEKGQIDPPGGDKDRDLVDDPLTLDDVLDTIEARIKRRLESSGSHAVYKSLAEQIEKLRSQAMQRSEDSIEFLKKALQVAKTAVEAERLEEAGELDDGAEALLDPNIGALTQIVEEYKPEGTPIIVADVARDIDAIVKQVRFTGWNSTQDGDRIVRKELREKVLLKYGLPPTGPLFDNAYAYVAENY
ncbi:MAG: HsdR family type I site-specific deoxyribonuclease [Nocardioides sp.]